MTQATNPLTAVAFEHFHARRYAAAEQVVRDVLTATPTDAGAWHLLGQLAEAAGHPDDAVQYLRQSLQLAPNEFRVWNDLGTLYEAVGNIESAVESFEAALKIRPAYAPALHNLGEVERSRGRPREAVARYREALAVDPNLNASASSLLFTLQFDPAVSQEKTWEEHRRWGEAFVRRVQSTNSAATRCVPFTQTADPDRPLVVGYVSPDFRDHAVARFFEPLLAAHDRSRFRYVLYSECPIVDAVGNRLRAFNDTWRVIRGQSAAKVAEQVRADHVDVLVDLAGHTRDNRLDVFALRAAPVQGTGLGYPLATGLPTIDFRITDAVLDPIMAPPRSGFGESPLRLPTGVFCFRPPDDAPAVSPPPMLSSGAITFGSPHPLAKLSVPLLTLWSRIARRVPTARFLFARSNWSPSFEHELRTRLTEVGFPQDRVEVRKIGAAPNDYLPTFHDIDLILDSWPFTGHTMTNESLWMGVPVLTLRGDRPCGRLSASVLTALNLPELIAESPDEYVDQAATLAFDPQRLAAYRSRLRTLVQDRLGRGEQWARPLENGYREAWRNWCRHTRSDPVASANTTPTPPTPPVDWPSHGAPPMTSRASSPNWVEIHEAACATLSAGNYDEAESLFLQAIDVAPQALPPRAMYAARLVDRCEMAQADQHYQIARRYSNDPKIRIAAATALPPIYDSIQQVADCRGLFERRVAKLHAEGVRLDPSLGPIPNVFMLAYQGENDVELMRSFASLFSPPPDLLEPPPRSPQHDGRIRVGIISEYFCNHTIGTLNCGLATQLDRSRFHLTVLSATGTQDDTSAAYRKNADQFVPLPGRTLDAIRLIRSLGLDILLFTDLGMSVITLSLAHIRLARRQALLWGHPVTTGIRTIDDFISGELYEPADAASHYTERLVKLPGLQTCYQRPKLETPARRGDFGLPDQGTLYACPQTLFKFHPAFDSVLNRIFDTDPEGRLVLVKGRQAYWVERIMKRWRQTAPRVAERVIWLPPLARSEFIGMLSVVDAALDTHHFGGGNTTLETLAVGTPVVTLPAAHLRGRLAAGMYTHIGLEDMISTTEDNYVRDAVRLGRDREWNQAVRMRIRANADGLFEHTDSIRAFENYFAETR